MSTSATSPAPLDDDARPARTIEQIEADLAAQRAALAADLEELGARLAPEALKEQAARSARQAVGAAQHKVTGAAAGLRDRACEAVAAARGRVEDALISTAPRQRARKEGSCPLGRARTAVHGLTQQAAAGQPRALAVTALTVVALAGVSTYALVRATRA